MKLEFSGQIFEKYLDIKFHENSSSGSLVVPCGQTDWHDEARSLFSQFLRTYLETKQFVVYRDVKVRFHTRVRSYKPFHLFTLRQTQYLKRIYSAAIELSVSDEFEGA